MFFFCLTCKQNVIIHVFIYISYTTNCVQNYLQHISFCYYSFTHVCFFLLFIHFSYKDPISFPSQFTSFDCMCVSSFFSFHPSIIVVILSLFHFFGCTRWARKLLSENGNNFLMVSSVMPHIYTLWKKVKWNGENSMWCWIGASIAK